MIKTNSILIVHNSFTLKHPCILFPFVIMSQYIAQIIRPPVQNPCEFLIRHLTEDLEHLGRALGKGVDDTVTTVHLMLSWALEPPQNVPCKTCYIRGWLQQVLNFFSNLLKIMMSFLGPAGYDNVLSTKEARNAWEIALSHNVITPKLKASPDLLHITRTLHCSI